MNWLERARSEIPKRIALPTANSAEGNPTAVTAVPTPADYGKSQTYVGGAGSVPPWRNVEVNAREDFEERAAIMEFDGSLDREEAERAAWDLISRRYLLH